MALQIYIKALSKEYGRVFSMNNLTKKELNEVKGGGIGTYLLIGGIIVFIIGIVDGYVRPLKCNR